MARHTRATLNMYRIRPRQDAQFQPAYATHSDFCEVLTADFKPLYLLAFLLTGSHADAERCFIATVEEALNAKCVFKGRERTWSKRCLMLNAIHRVFASPSEREGKVDSWREPSDESDGSSVFDRVTRLTPPLERFVFVMSVLERYSDHECALLLGRTRREVFEARIEALRQLSDVEAALIRNAGPNAA